MKELNSFKEESSSLSSLASLIVEKPLQDESSSTSKQSVLKYWNQFFNKDIASSNNLTRNNNQHVSRSAYQTNSAKEGQDQLVTQFAANEIISQSQSNFF